MYLILTVLRATLRIRRIGVEHIKKDTPYIFAMWHDHNGPMFATSFFRDTGGDFILLNHPIWVMKPVHVLLRLLGVRRLALGSTGHGGRAAATEVVAALKRGCYSHINPDGPAGPPHQLKKGVLHIAAESGAAIVPVQFHCERQWVLKSSWDGKRLPLPFSRVTIQYGEPINVLRSDCDTTLFRVIEGLG